MLTPGYVFPLAIQTTLPEDYENAGFQRQLELLQSYGFSGIELNIVRPQGVHPGKLSDYLGRFGLRLSMLATGATAKAEGLSLSHLDSDLRLASVERCLDMIEYAAELGAGVIVGFLKGGLSPEPARARELFRDSLSRLEQQVGIKQVPFLVEATNRYESSVGNSLSDVADLIQDFCNPFLRLLPDTFHMNIEERDGLGALVKYQVLYDSVHISDNNRLFPGLGGLDLFGVLRFLKDIGYEGGVAIEGNVRESFERDLGISMSLLGPMLSALNER